jgi:DNA polymerase III subunit beta
MRFTVSREALGEAVAFVSRALPSRPVVPVLSGILVDAAAGGLTLSCFDYEVSARIRVDAEVAEPGTALVPGKLLAEITRSLPARPAECASDGDMVVLRCGRAEFGLVCLPAADYPALPHSPAAAGVVDGGVLASAVAQVASSASRDDTLPMLTAICLDISGATMTLAATDRYRLAARAVDFLPAEPGLRALALVPARFLADAAKTFAAGTPVTVAFGDGHAGHPAAGASRVPNREASGEAGTPRPAEGMACFETGDRRMTARLIAGEFIRYSSRFGGEYACRAEMPAGPVIEAVRRASLVAERAGPVRLSFQPDQVVIEAQAEGRARAAEAVGAGFTGPEPVIAFNPHFLLDGLTAAAVSGSGPGQDVGQGDVGQGDVGQEASAADAAPGDGAPPGGAGQIRLEFNTPAKPALITWTADEQRDGVFAFRYLLVPLRVAERA